MENEKVYAEFQNFKDYLTPERIAEIAELLQDLSKKGLGLTSLTFATNE